MRIEEKNYNTKLVRPAPFVFQSQSMDLLIILTSWGEGKMKEVITNDIEKFLFAAQGDFEATSPFEYNLALTKDSNSLRMATLIANDQVYRSENNSELRTCYEILVLLKNKFQLSWVQVGNPNVILLSDDPIPITFSPPAMKPKKESSLSLPGQFLGTEMHCHFQVGTVEIQEGDKLLLFSDNSLSPSSWILNKKDSTLDSFVKSQIKHHSENPFWMGLVSL